MGDSQETSQRGTVVPDTVPPTDHGRADELPPVLHGRARTAWRATATRSRLVLSRMITTVGRASRGGEIGGGGIDLACSPNAHAIRYLGELSISV